MSELSKNNEISKKDILNGYDDYLNVGELKKFINRHSIPESAKVLIQRVEDIYYNELSWGVYLKEGEHSFKNEDGTLDKSSMEQYHPAWCCVKYKDEDDTLFIDLHY